MTWPEARVFARAGRRVRRMVWRDKWVTFLRGFFWLQPVNASTLVDGPPRIVRGGYDPAPPDVTGEDLAADDWTLDPLAPLAGALATVVCTEILGPGLPNPALNLFGDFPPGDYRMAYVEGAHYFSNSGGVGINSQLRMIGWRIRPGAAADVVFPFVGSPGPELRFSNDDPRSESQLLDAIKTTARDLEVTFTHPGGIIAMWLSDTPYSDNRPSAIMPTFSLFAA